MIELFLAAAAGLLSGLVVGGFAHRARYRAWSAERDLLKSQIDDDEDGITDIDFDEIVETTLRNRAMGVEPIGLAALIVARRESAPSGIDRSSNDFWKSGLVESTYGDLVLPLDRCDCQFCKIAHNKPGPNLYIIPRGK